jgi:hypothetical protein
LPAQFVEGVHAIVVGVNCRNCGHAHLLVEPKRAAVTLPIDLANQKDSFIENACATTETSDGSRMAAVGDS